MKIRWTYLMTLIALPISFILFQNFTTSSVPTAASVSTTRYVGKKGIGYGDKSRHMEKNIQKLNLSWHYTWSFRIPDYVNKPLSKDLEWVPMMWNGKSLKERMEPLRPLAQQKKIEMLLGFNEPDGKNQANMTVDEALALWPELESLGVPLCSPAPVNPNGVWMDEFMKRAKERNLRIDAICLHLYGGTDPQVFADRLEVVYQKYHMPIWLTEFAPYSSRAYKTKKIADNGHKIADVQEFMRKMLPYLDNLEYIERYGWMPAFYEDRMAQLATAAVFHSDSTLTNLGKIYASHVSEEVIVPQGNLLSNGDFDQPLGGSWLNFRSSVNDSILKIASGSGGVTQTLNVVPGKRYKLSFSSRWENEANGTFPVRIINTKSNSVLKMIPVPQGTNTSRSEMEFLCPPGVQQVRISIYKTDGDIAAAGALPAVFFGSVKFGLK